ncbi:coatomer protein complex, subunit alpha [Syncephalis plumigaleata]|nr:coatomer protein complex, subunit alpha [Syncephalis plumigaleata]
MHMLTKFESKSNRVKGLSFHPKRPWILASLHNGSIQLWDYRMGTLLEKYEEHEGPVRGVHFHPSQPLFVSGGDDNRVKLWNYKTRRCLFTFSGHIDYVRTVFFHHEHPWIVSCSDDQTIRIWNWQSRTCVAVLTGHNHYVMCAQFHPSEDLLVSASMDQTVRVWDISGLRKKNKSKNAVTVEDLVSRATGQPDLFGNSDCSVKFVLEGHDRGVDWVTFHPTMPLILSSGDDRQIKLWRMSDVKAWEVDSFRGHMNNVSCVLFHPTKELLISDSEDKTIRVWDMQTRTAVQTFRRDQDRFWILASHPELNLFAAGHDNGLLIFKLDRERPASVQSQNSLFFVRDRVLRLYDFTRNVDQPIMSIRRSATPYTQPRSISFNPAERAVLVCSAVDGGTYDLYSLPKEFSGDLRDCPEPKRGSGTTAIFTSRTRFAVLDKAEQQIYIKDMSNTVTKTIKPTHQVTEIFFAGANYLLLATPTAVILFDTQQRQAVAELAAANVKYVAWSADMTHIALMSKHTIYLATKTLEQKASIHETIRIKSGVWDESGVFLYTTLNHIKYTLVNGDHGIIRTLEQPVYLVRSKGANICCMERDGEVHSITIDPTEYQFKLALVRERFDQVLQIIRTSNLVGQSIIAYLQKKGYPEVALQFVRDTKTRFELAIECGNLTVAMEEAKKLDRVECWSKLGAEALKQGNTKITETAYQRTKNFERLSFLYMATGNTENQRKMLKIAGLRGDGMSRFHNALYLGDIRDRVKFLTEMHMYPLAYLTAKSHGLDDEAVEILALANKTEEELTDLPTPGQLLRPPVPVNRLDDSNWPLKEFQRNAFERAFVSGQLDSTDMAETEITATTAATTTAASSSLAFDALESFEAEEEVEVGAGWGLGDDMDLQLDTDIAGAGGIGGVASGRTGNVAEGTPETELWCHNSPLAADHVAAGNFESAMQLLHRQAGIVNFAPLKEHFLTIYSCSRAWLSGVPTLPPFSFPMRRNWEETDLRKVLPVQPYSQSTIDTALLQPAYKSFISGQFKETIVQFRDALHSLLLTVGTSASDAQQLRQVMEECREYIIGLSMEVARREIATQDSFEANKRSLELAAYFSHCKMRTPHQILTLRAAMAQAYKAKNFLSASSFARRLLDLRPMASLAKQAQQIKEVSDRTPRDEIPLDYDHYSEFIVCAISYQPIYQGDAHVRCPCCTAIYRPEHKGTLCPVCQLAKIGTNGTGLRQF